MYNETTKPLSDIYKKHFCRYVKTYKIFVEEHTQYYNKNNSAYSHVAFMTYLTEQNLAHVQKITNIHTIMTETSTRRVFLNNDM